MGYDPRRKPKGLDTPEPPRELVYVWEWYNELWSPNPLTYTEIQAWAQVTRTRVTGWEVDLLRSIDRVYWRVSS